MTHVDRAAAIRHTVPAMGKAATNAVGWRPGQSMTIWAHADLETNGIRLHVLRGGAAERPVVMLHGLVGSGTGWTPIARALASEHDVVLPDLRGHGDSSAPSQGYTYGDHAADVVGLIRGLGLDRPVLVGHSMGGMIAAVVASEHPELLRGVVLVDPTFLDPERQREVHVSDVAAQHRQMLRLSKAEIVAQARARHPARALEIVELQAEARLKTSLAAFDVLVPPNPDYSDVVRAIAVPTLLVIGDDGNVVTLEMVESLRAINPRVRCEQIANAGHGLPFEQPAKLAEVVQRFLRDLE